MAKPAMIPIRQLQTAIARLKTERGHVQQLIDQYDQLLNARLGTLTIQLTELRQAMQQKQGMHSRRRSEQDRFTVNRDQRTVNSPGGEPQPINQSTNNQSTNTQSHSLKKLYRQAVSLAHPDRFAGDPDREARATEVMSQLNAAYARDDLEAVSDLLADLEDGLPFLDLPGPVRRSDGTAGSEPDPQALERIQKRLTQTHDALVRELATLRQTEAYRIMTADAIDLATHFDKLERRCLLQIDRLRNELEAV